MISTTSVILGVIIGAAVTHFLDGERGREQLQAAREGAGATGRRLQDRLGLFVRRSAGDGGNGTGQLAENAADAAAELAEKGADLAEQVDAGPAPSVTPPAAETGPAASRP